MRIQLSPAGLTGLLSMLMLASTGCDVSADCLPWFRGVNCLQSDLGQVCSRNEETVRKVTIRPNSNDVVADPGFENCNDFLCASTNQSRPYCTRRCETVLDCDVLGLPCVPGQPCAQDQWRCEVVIEFGELACKQTNETGGCEIDEATGKVKDPVKYCRAVEGTIETADPNPPLDGGVQ